MTRIFFSIILLVLLGVSSVNNVFGQKSKTVQIDVRVVAGKPTGEDRGTIMGKAAMLWDVKGEFEKPDLAICISENNAPYKCVQNDCGDSYLCPFIGVPISGNNFKIRVWDKDLFEHDIIGEETCSINRTCNIGQAQVRVTEVPCADDEIVVNFDKEATGHYDVAKGFVKYRASYHLYNLENPICSTTNPKCTLDSVFSTMTSQLQFVAPVEGSTLSVKNCFTSDVNIPGPFGKDPIRVVVNPVGHYLTNYTRKDHVLYPGKVTRSLVQKKNQIYVVTEGEGFGIFPDINTMLDASTWNPVDKRLSEAVRQKISK